MSLTCIQDLFYNNSMASFYNYITPKKETKHFFSPLSIIKLQTLLITDSSNVL